jgi:hypothetical protein
MENIQAKDGYKQIYIGKGKEAFVLCGEKIIHSVGEGNTLITPATNDLKIGTIEEVATAKIGIKTELQAKLETLEAQAVIELQARQEIK